MEHPSRSIQRPFCELLAQCRLLTAPKEDAFPNQIQLFDLAADDKLEGGRMLQPYTTAT